MNTSMAWCEQAAEALRHSTIPALRRIRVQGDGERVVLYGQVSSYYYKQLAQETVLPVLGNGCLDNRVSVVLRPGAPGSPPATLPSVP